MTEDTGTTASAAAPTADAPAPDAPVPDAGPAAASAEDRKAQISALFKLIRNAIDLAGMSHNLGLLQIAAFLIDEACDLSSRTHADGIAHVQEVLAKVQADRDEASSVVDELMAFIEKVRGGKRPTKKAAQG
jgi:hypothetical protein